jgi:tetratricopeptide (TPR) repeat protein
VDEPAEARALLEEALTTWRKLVADEPGSAVLLEYQFGCVDDLAALDPENFAELALEAAGIAGSLVELDGGNAGYQRLQLRANWRLGDMDVRADDLACAEGHFTGAVTQAQRLADGDPGSVEAQRDLAAAFRRQAGYARAAARPEEVRGNLERSLELTEALVHRFPRNGAFHRDLAESREHLGDWLRDSGDPVPARALYRQALASRRRRAALDPEDHASRLAQAAVHARIAELDEAAGHPGRARRQWQEALELARQLDNTDQAAAYAARLA